MPHSTHSTSDSRTNTLNGGIDHESRKSVTAAGMSNKSSGAVSAQVGTAHTSRDERSTLPSQNANAWKRNSSPVVPDGFAELLRSGGNIDEVLASRKAGDRSSVASRLPGDRISTVGTYNMDKQRTQYYEEQFQYKDNVMRQTHDRVQRDSPVIAELKTNVIIKDEFTLVRDLSYHLAQRYTKPDSSVMIKVDHSACLALGGTFDPCYIMDITAVPSLMGPTVNKRNAALIQSFMADILSVPAERGIIKFQKVEESDYAMNGTTILGEIERLEKNGQSQDSTNAVKRAITNASRKSMPSFKKSTTKLDTEVNVPNGTPTSTEIRRRSAVNDGSRNTPLPNVFELAATDVERPSTAHGAQYAAENGLRMNGISKEDLVGAAAKTPNGRPKTFAGQTVAMHEQIHAEPMPKVQRQSSQQSQKRSQHITSAAKPLADSKKANTPLSAKPAQTTTPKMVRSSTGPSQARSKETYLDKVSTLTTITNTMRKEERPDPKLDAKAAERERAAARKDTEANTAKRRSTITATPKMPPPPPVPESRERREAKVGKRKSFLAAFRRSTAAA